MSERVNAESTTEEPNQYELFSYEGNETVLDTLEKFPSLKPLQDSESSPVLNRAAAERHLGNLPTIKVLLAVLKQQVQNPVLGPRFDREPNGEVIRSTTSTIKSGTDVPQATQRSFLIDGTQYYFSTSIAVENTHNCYIFEDEGIVDGDRFIQSLKDRSSSDNIFTMSKLEDLLNSSISTNSNPKLSKDLLINCLCFDVASDRRIRNEAALVERFISALILFPATGLVRKRFPTVLENSQASGDSSSQSSSFINQKDIAINGHFKPLVLMLDKLEGKLASDELPLDSDTSYRTKVLIEKGVILETKEAPNGNTLKEEALEFEMEVSDSLCPFLLPNEADLTFGLRLSQIFNTNECSSELLLVDTIGEAKRNFTYDLDELKKASGSDVDYHQLLCSPNARGSQFLRIWNKVINNAIACSASKIILADGYTVLLVKLYPNDGNLSCLVGDFKISATKNLRYLVLHFLLDGCDYSGIKLEELLQSTQTFSQKVIESNLQTENDNPKDAETKDTSKRSKRRADSAASPRVTRSSKKFRKKDDGYQLTGSDESLADIYSANDTIESVDTSVISNVAGYTKIYNDYLEGLSRIPHQPANVFEIGRLQEYFGKVYYASSKTVVFEVEQKILDILSIPTQIKDTFRHQKLLLKIIPHVTTFSNTPEECEEVKNKDEYTLATEIFNRYGDEVSNHAEILQRSLRDNISITPELVSMGFFFRAASNHGNDVEEQLESMECGMFIITVCRGRTAVPDVFAYHLTPRQREQILTKLDYIHDQGIIHGDLEYGKNITLGENLGEPLFIDWGESEWYDPEEQEEEDFQNRKARERSEMEKLLAGKVLW